MAQPYVGEIRMFGGNFAPAGWMFCDGALLPISENEILFTLIGTTDRDYEGDPSKVKASAEEIEYLCGSVSEYLAKPVTPQEKKARMQFIKR